MKRIITYLIDDKNSGKSVEQYLKEEKNFSSTLLRHLKLFPDGILRNGIHIRTIDVLYKGDTLTINIPNDTQSAEPSNVFVKIAYEDEDVMVLNKPASMPVHPTHNHQNDTLANAFSGILKQRGTFSTFRAINRLDRDTSGLVVIGKNPYSASRLTGHVKKTYYAIIHGKLHGCGKIDLPIYRPNPLLIKRAVGNSGERAVTYWTSIAGTDKLTLLRIHLETGRTHQIRVHFSHLGYPLVGDTMYGKHDTLLSRQALHCKTVSFLTPVNQTNVIVDSEFPQDMKNIIQEMSIYESN